MLEKKLIRLIDESISLSKKNKYELYIYLKNNPEKIGKVMKILIEEKTKNNNILQKYK